MPHSESHPTAFSPPAADPAAGESPTERFFDRSPELLCVIGADGTILRANPAFGRAFGWAESELHGRAMRELVHPEDRERAAAEAARLRTGEPGLGFRARYVRRDGSHRWIEWQSSAPDDLGRLYVSGRDVTEAEAAQAELRLKSQLLSAVGQAVIATDTRGIVTFWSAAAETMYGWRTEEAVGRSIVDLTPTRASRAQAEEIMAALSQGEGWSGEFDVRRKDGSEFRALVTDSVIRDERGLAIGVVGISTDLTARVRTEQAMRASEARYRQLVETTHEGIWTVDAVGTTTYVNARLAAMLGVSESAIVGRPMFDFMPPDAAFEARTLFARRQRRISDVHEHRLRRADGSDMWAILAMSPLLDEQGQFAGALAMVTDITERKRVEAERERLVAALEFERARLMSIFERAAPAFTAIFRGADHRIEMANEACRRLVGGRDIVGRPLREALPELDEQGFPEVLDRVLATGEPFASGVVPVPLARASGAPPETRHVDFVYLPLVEPDGSRSGVLLQGVDVTEQVVATETLRETERQVRAQFDAIPVPVLALRAVGEDFVIVDHNAAAASLPRRAPGPLVLQRASNVLVDHPELLADFRRALADRVVLRREIEWPLPGGGTQHFTITSGAVSADRIILHVEDVTERRRLEAQLRQSSRMEAIGQLAGGVAHDFNNLLTVIKTYSELLLEQLDSTNPMHEDVAEIQKAAARAASLTRQLLAFSRKQVLQPRVLDLGAVITGMEPMLRRLIGEDIQIVLRPDAELGKVRADPGQLEQVVMNLAVNARDAMPGGGTLTIETSDLTLDAESAGARGLAAPGAYVRLAVRDTGIGMDAATRSRVFEPFFTTKEVGRGTGLGLSTVYGIVQQSEGHISLESEPGVGTTFTVLLPCITDAPGTGAGTGATPAIPRGSERVLLVEDEDAVRALARRILERQGYTVIEARDGADALRVAERHGAGIDVLVTDMVMPGLGGSQVYGALREARPGLRVVYMSGYTDDEILRRGLSDGDGAFVQKPFAASALASAVRTVLDGPAPGSAPIGTARAG